MKRRFSRSEANQLHVAAGGKCQDCGRELLEDFHADHVIPYSKGGITDVINGQALCPVCNLRKGARVPYTEPSLWTWQKEALQEYFAKEGGLRSQFLCEATPGAGKTRFALAAASRLLRSASVERIFVVVPRTSLKEQWKIEAHEKFGIKLNARWVKGWAPDFDGVAITYHQLYHSAAAIRSLSYRTGFVIMDEIHHCNEDASWGQALFLAFEEAAAKLALSGTPFRSDNGRIPFIEYTDDEGRPNFCYGYKKALDDRVVRSLFFPQMGGTVRWLPPGKTEERHHSFDDDLSERDSQTRLRMAVRPDGEWFTKTIKLAHERLCEYRSTDAAPGGIVFTPEQTEAHAAAKVIERITGEKVVVVTSNDPEAPQKLAAFKDSSDPWIVAVQMVSEGIDIPRLRVAVYATVFTKPMFFRQAIGRVVRKMKGETDSTAAVYIPDDPKLRAMAESIQDIVVAQIRADQDRPDRDGGGAERGSGPLFLSSDGEHVGTLTPRGKFSQEELVVARQTKLLDPTITHLKDEEVAIVLRLRPASPAPLPVVATQEMPLDDRKRALRKQANGLFRSLAYRFDLPFKEVMWKSKQAAGIDSLEEATLDQLEAWKSVAYKWHAQGCIDG